MSLELEIIKQLRAREPQQVDRKDRADLAFRIMADTVVLPGAASTAIQALASSLTAWVENGEERNG